MRSIERNMRRHPTVVIIPFTQRLRAQRLRAPALIDLNLARVDHILIQPAVSVSPLPEQIRAENVLIARVVEVAVPLITAPGIRIKILSRVEFLVPVAAAALLAQSRRQAREIELPVVAVGRRRGPGPIADLIVQLRILARRAHVFLVHQTGPRGRPLPVRVGAFGRLLQHVVERHPEYSVVIPRREDCRPCRGVCGVVDGHFEGLRVRRRVQTGQADVLQHAGDDLARVIVVVEVTVIVVGVIAWRQGSCVPVPVVCSAVELGGFLGAGGLACRSWPRRDFWLQGQGLNTSHCKRRRHSPCSWRHLGGRFSLIVIRLY